GPTACVTESSLPLRETVHVARGISPRVSRETRSPLSWTPCGARALTQRVGDRGRRVPLSLSKKWHDPAFLPSNARCVVTCDRWREADARSLEEPLHAASKVCQRASGRCGW